MQVGLSSSVVALCGNAGHAHAKICRGDKDSDRTSGQAAVMDFQPFVDAGITTFDTAGMHLLSRLHATKQASL